MPRWLPIGLLGLLLLASSSGRLVQADAIGDIIKQQGQDQEENAAPTLAKPTPPPPPKEPARTEKTGGESTYKIIIDPGHGGKDTGAIGHGAVLEKEIVLQISRRLAKRLKKVLGAKVEMTRNSDRFITLDKRDEIAVKQQVDLFLSIHANAAERKTANGIEIYYLNNATDEASRRLANRENKGSRRSRSSMEEILSQIILNDSTAYSRMLAENIQDSLDKSIRSRYKMQRLEIKSALFYVLVGSKAPSLLLEVGFISNPTEARRLSQAEYQQRLVDAIADGVVAYFNMLKSKNLVM